MQNGLRPGTIPRRWHRALPLHQRPLFALAKISTRRVTRSTPSTVSILTARIPIPNISTLYLKKTCRYTRLAWQLYSKTSMLHTTRNKRDITNKGGCDSKANRSRLQGKRALLSTDFADLIKVTRLHQFSIRMWSQKRIWQCQPFTKSGVPTPEVTANHRPHRFNHKLKLLSTAIPIVLGAILSFSNSLVSPTIALVNDYRIEYR